MEAYKITKSPSHGEERADSTPSEEELELIAAYTRKPVSAQDVYVFTVTLCDNEIDRDGERFCVEALESLGRLFVGVTGIFDHSMKSSDQTARIFATYLQRDESRLTAQGEAYTALKARCYMPRSEKNALLIEEIDMGIKKEISISCSVAKRLCSICGEDLRTGKCRHVLGKQYGSKRCHAVLCEPTDAYEWSFVAVPAQKMAGVSKSFNSSDGTENAHKDKLDYESRKALEFLNEARLGAQRELTRLCAFVLPTADTAVFSEMLSKLSHEDVFMLKKAFEDKAVESGAYEARLTAAHGRENDNSHFKI